MEPLFHDFCNFVQSNPSMLIFASLAGGYALGKVKVKNFSLGSTTSVLIVAIVLGATLLDSGTDLHMGLIKTVAFGLFIFGIGYKVGPDFIGGLRRGGAKYLLVSVFFAVVALVAAVVLAHLFGLNKGYTAGLVGGALTQSSVIGTADGALRHLQGLPPSAEINLESDVAVAYAVTYVFGTAGLIILLKIIAAAWRVDLKAQARQAEKELGSVDVSESWEAFQWSNLVSPRAYRVQKDTVIGKTVAELEGKNADDPGRLFPERVAIDRIKKGEQLIKDITPELVLQKDDIVLLVGFESSMFKAGKMIGEEVDDQSLRDLVGEILEICLTNKKLDGKTLKEIVDDHGHGCFVRHVLRQGHELPFALNMTLHRGDVLQVMGEHHNVEALAKAIGCPERKSDVTDLVTVGIGVILGTLLGLIAVPVAGIPITLGVGGGVLISGLFFGWMRSIKPTWGRIPTPALWIFIDLGLNLFIACVGIAAGPRALAALAKAGASIFIAGVLLTCIPHVLSWLFGLYVLKLNPVLLLGAMTGSGTCTAALNAVRDDSNSAVPVIGYTVPYAVGNVLLTVWGALIVHMI
jgi:putative transport protein